MSVWRAAAPGKVNLALFLGPAREDGYHEIVTLVQALTLADELVLEPAPEGARADEVVCPGVEGDNLAALALRLFREATGWEAPPVRLSIDKRVPVAAGMGGGSSNAAAALRLAAAAAGRPAGDGLTAELAPRVGADVAALLEPGLVLAEGFGERVTPLEPLDPAPTFVVVPLPGAELSTPAVFAEADRLELPRDAGELAQERAGLLPPGRLHNDLEPAARSLCPAVAEALHAFYLLPASPRDGLVSGSGPTVFGVWDDRAEAERAAAELAERFPGTAIAEPAPHGMGAPEPVGTGGSA